MYKKTRSRWYLSIVGLGAFVAVAILTLIFDLNVYTMLGFLTAAIILVTINIVYVFYTKTKSTEKKK